MIALVPLTVCDVGQSTITCPEVCVAVTVAGELNPDRFTTSFPVLHCGILGLETVIEQGVGVGTGVGLGVGAGVGLATGVGLGCGVAVGLGVGVGVGVGKFTLVPLCAAFNASMSHPTPGYGDLKSADKFSASTY